MAQHSLQPSQRANAHPTTDPLRILACVDAQIRYTPNNGAPYHNMLRF